MADFAGRPSPSAHPEAELWLGANPGDPARLETADGEVSLLDVIRADPAGELGPEVVARFGEADRASCLEYIEREWTDIRPKSLRDRLAVGQQL